MGRVERVDGEARWVLRDRNIVGRSHACGIRLSDPTVSGEHASLRWVGNAWEIQDLGSRNGTWVDGRQLAPNERAGLSLGSVLGFGRPDGHVLVDADEPAAFATPMAGAGEPVVAQGGILPLPAPDRPEVMIFRGDLTWSIEQVGEVAPIEDGAVVWVGDTNWRLHLPAPLPRTADTRDRPPRLDELTLRFAVGRGEQQIALVAVHGERVVDLKVRAHHRLLLQLARARLDQRALPSAQQGWVDQEQLLTLHDIDRGQLHLAVFRARRQLGEAGILDAARVVERSEDNRLRIGVPRLEILALPDAV